MTGTHIVKYTNRSSTENIKILIWQVNRLSDNCMCTYGPRQVVNPLLFMRLSDHQENLHDLGFTELTRLLLKVTTRH